MTGEELLRIAVEREKEDIKIYKDYVKHTTSRGIGQLLSSLIDQEEEHEREINTLLGRDDLDTLFNGKDLAVFQADSYLPSSSYSQDLSTNDFLNHVIEREDMGVKFYSSLAGMCLPEDVAFMFNNLSFEEQKHKSWAVNRYELEMLAGL